MKARFKNISFLFLPRLGRTVFLRSVCATFLVWCLALLAGGATRLLVALGLGSVVQNNILVLVSSMQAEMYIGIYHESNK